LRAKAALTQWRQVLCVVVSVFRVESEFGHESFLIVRKRRDFVFGLRRWSVANVKAVQILEYRRGRGKVSTQVTGRG
jgi:hypothetical protein